MHDIGKVAIPDEILKKPGRFTKSERKIMETHAQIGYEMIRHSDRPLLKAAAIVAYEHHEKWDGSGYPRGLKGDEIHIYGRITALADVFDALGSDRVYKKAWPLEKIYKLINEERGKHFDPNLVDVFFEKKKEILRVREEFKDAYEESVIRKNEERASIRVLGAYGTKLKGFGTSSFLLNQKNVLDAGNLIDTLEEFSVNLDTIWLTHSHLDHISDIAYILDDYYAELQKPICIAARVETIEALKTHFFNDVVWPDFSKIPLIHGEGNCIEYMPVELGKRYPIANDEFIEAIATDHTVPSCGYIYTQKDRSILITADTYSVENIIERINNDKSISAAVIECSFPSRFEKLAQESKHLTPKLLFDALDEKLKRDDLTLYINHIKPVYLNEMIEEIEQKGARFSPIITTDKKNLHF